ncbi:MAG TPA: hypothetical protein VFR00_07335 [Hyphomicrobiaceae bacterium]|jgi:hypothetical protein|nr:hypothetical protein [Hyphomicrobiaceae bacterium]HEU0159108.1 hypothetical protein [Hyphomicrobiaceae bacterium]
MKSRSVVPEILDRLEPHLESLELAWSAQADGKMELLYLHPRRQDQRTSNRARFWAPETLEQHFYSKPDLAGPVNALALFKIIGSWMLDDVADEGMQRRLKQTADDRSDLRKALAEREALFEALRAENARLKANLDLIEETGLAMRLDAMTLVVVDAIAPDPW